MGRLALSAIGVDRPGIVAAVARVLAECGANVEDSAMTILGGQFAMMLVVATDDSADALRTAVEPVARELGLAIMVTVVEEHHGGDAPTHLVSVYGTDRPGMRRPHPNHGLVVMFDPEILLAEGSRMGREGCLSIPDYTCDVRRATAVVVRGTTPEGLVRVVEAEGFEARAFQHELDHLDGRLILDRVASARTRRVSPQALRGRRRAPALTPQRRGRQHHPQLRRLLS